jgi:hypothetical protein
MCHIPPLSPISPHHFAAGNKCFDSANVTPKSIFPSHRC